MCCGRNPSRSPFIVPSHGLAKGPVGLTSPVGFSSGPAFQYLGGTALTIIGPVSGARYRFEQTGSQLHVDPRDRAALLRVPVLRLISQPVRS